MQILIVLHSKHEKIAAERYSALHKGKADKLAGTCGENATGETVQARAKWKHEGTRRSGRPRRRWIHGVEENLRRMGVQDWTNVATQREREREIWRRVVAETKGPVELRNKQRPYFLYAKKNLRNRII